jgi:hypothetical protein
MAKEEGRLEGWREGFQQGLREGLLETLPLCLDIKLGSKGKMLLLKYGASAMWQSCKPCFGL